MRKHERLARYLTLRVLQAVVVMWAALTFAFLVLYIIPGDPARIILGGATPGQAPTPAQLAAVSREYGFNRPVIIQYFSYLSNALRGNLGLSYQNGRPVTAVLGQALPGTAALAGLALIFAIIIGAILAALIAYPRSQTLANLFETIPAVSVSAPTFWVGLLLIEAFSFRLHLLPPAGQGGFNALIMPAVTMALPASAVFAQVLARSLETTMAEPYVQVIRAKGASRLRVFTRHALRGALIPAVTVLGVQSANMFALSTITETVFSRYGIGSVLAQAVQFKDVPLVLGVTIFIVCVYVVINLVVDLIYPLIDPRLRGQQATRATERQEVAEDALQR